MLLLSAARSCENTLPGAAVEEEGKTGLGDPSCRQRRGEGKRVDVFPAGSFFTSQPKGLQVPLQGGRVLLPYILLELVTSCFCLAVFGDLTGISSLICGYIFTQEGYQMEWRHRYRPERRGRRTSSVRGSEGRVFAFGVGCVVSASEVVFWL